MNNIPLVLIINYPMLKGPASHGLLFVQGISALGYAVWAGHLATTKVLIEYGLLDRRMDLDDSSGFHGI